MLVRPVSKTAQAWVDAHVPDALWFGESLAVDVRYLAQLVKGMRDDDLVVTG